ncbi:MAG TPA: glycerophosphodiester phosphodiesterase [Clostridia bacterium]|jgi:glycerophosphoryl diester phosphodiesterase|nr:glycerophosphodiester phosphodiesterase [Clostridia bacterium]HQO55054.1 glycerophosphodiester phosphodiesterase [Clostridia bacterium]HUM59847.1 glycerophosphodiester phosphodiesterase [Clostridia bacterium]
MSSQIFAHRGASGYAPENTLEAFEMAAKMGAHGVELDVHICRSGELVVAHDETLERVSDGEGWIKDYSLTELKKLHFNRTHPEFSDARMPTLQEVFRLLQPTGLRINVEMKNSLIDYPDLERGVIDLAEKEGMIDRLIFSSFNHHSLLRVKAIDKRFYCGLLYDATLVKPWAYAVALGMDALHPNYTEVLLQRGECSEAHKAGIQVNPWTVNNEADIRGCLETGADILIGNYPDRSLRLLKEWEAVK